MENKTIELKGLDCITVKVGKDEYSLVNREGELKISSLPLDKVISIVPNCSNTISLKLKKW